MEKLNKGDTGSNLHGWADFFFVFFLSLLIYCERQRHHEWGAGRERERGRERIPSRVCAVIWEPDSGLELTKP